MNPIKVRFPCEEHDVWFRHMVKPVGVKPVWCDGGTTRHLLLLGDVDTMMRSGDLTVGVDDGGQVWVEVER